jgi:hypothetical protein
MVTVGLKRKIAKVEKASDMQETRITSNTSREAVLEHQVRINTLIQTSRAESIPLI